jgi:hypothetical protein
MTSRIATLVFAVFVTAAGCAHRGSEQTRVQTSSPQLATPHPTTPIDLTASPASEWQKHLDETVTMHGKFSLYGKPAPYIIVSDLPIYIKPHGNFSWGLSYTRMEGRDVRVTGTLGFMHYPLAPDTELQQQRQDDYYYFDAETAKVELIQ